MFYADHDLNPAIAMKEAEHEWSHHTNVYSADTMAWCLYKNKKYPEAMKMMNKAMAHKTSEPLFFYHKGMIAAAMGDQGTAQSSLSQALTQSPNFAPLQSKIAFETLQKMKTQVSR